MKPDDIDVKKTKKRKRIAWEIIAAGIVLAFCISLLIALHRVVEKNITHSYMQGDWPYYETVEEIIDVSTNIYFGKITDISFEIVDMETGKIDNSATTESNSRMLYTIYTVEVAESLKGVNSSEIQFGIDGGIVGYQEKKQHELMVAAGLLPEGQGIPIWWDHPTLSQNETYLFCTRRKGGDFDYVINLAQFAYLQDSDEAKQIAERCR